MFILGARALTSERCSGCKLQSKVMRAVAWFSEGKARHRIERAYLADDDVLA